MSPRHNRRRQPNGRAARDLEDAARTRHLEEWPDGDWIVRPVTGAAAVKTYRCPGCDQEIRIGTPHVVAWPADLPAGGPADPGGAGLEHRRHWHRACWDARGRRRPDTLRSRNAPRYG